MKTIVCRPLRRLFYWPLMVALLAVAVGNSWAQTAKTQVVDSLYRADGTPAQGMLLISWPAFTTANGEAVAAGSMSVKIGAQGAVNIALFANTGSLPASSYKVTLKLTDGTTSDEYWTIPAVTSTTIGAVRSKVAPAAVAQQFVGRDYFETRLAQVALPTDLVHLAGDEQIAGTKTFAQSPKVPAPLATQDAATKKYVDDAVIPAVKTSGSYADPAWLTGVSATKITGTLPDTSIPANVAWANAANGWTQSQTFAAVSATMVNQTAMADRFAGADACAKIAAAIAALNPAGGTVDARGIQGAQSCAADPIGALAKPVTLLLGSATITSSATWTLASNLTIRGAGGGTTLAFTGAAAGLKSTGASGWKIEDLKINTTATSSAYAVNADAASANYVIDSISVLGAATNAVANGELYLQGQNVAVRNSTFDTITFVYCYQCVGGEATNNTFYNYRTGIYVGDTTGSTDRSFVVRGNRFLSAAGAVAPGYDAVLVESSRKVLVEANVVKAATEHCIYVSDGSAGSSSISLVGNSCSGWTGGAGIQVRGNYNAQGTFNENISVTGNTVLGSAVSGTFGVLCIGVRGLTVAANTVKYAQLDGFYFDNIVGGTITGNVASHNGTAGFRFGDDQNVGPSSGLTVMANQAVNNNLNGSGFSGFHLANAHGFAHKQLHFLGNFGGNTLPAVAISSVTRTSNVVTMTTAVPHFLVTGTYGNLVVAGVADATFNGTFSNVVLTVTDSTP